MDVCILALGVMMAVLLVGIILSKRHGRASALAVLMGIFLLSLAVALVAYLMLNQTSPAKPDPSNKWHKVAVPGGRVVKLRYQSEAGLSVSTEDNETHVLRGVPFCLANGPLAKLAPNYVETTGDPYVALPPSPVPFKQQISFNLSYAVSTTGLGASSFGIDQNNELWCTENLYKASGGVANSASLAGAYMAILIFAGIFAVMTIPVAVIFEVRRRWGRVKKAASGHLPFNRQSSIINHQ